MNLGETIESFLTAFNSLSNYKSTKNKSEVWPPQRFKANDTERLK